jgi:hypothetical protein
MKRFTFQSGARATAVLALPLLVAVFILGVFVSSARAVTYDPEEIAFAQLLNNYRVSAGLEPLLVSDELSESGDRHDSDMAKYDFFDHFTVASDWFAPGASPWDRMAASGYSYDTWKGENLAAGLAYVTAQGVFQGWRSSPGHNADMLNPHFKVVGVSRLCEAGSDYGCYWTTDFGGEVDPTAHALGPMEGAPAGTFADVGSGTLYADEIEAAAQKGIVCGYSNGDFGPYDSVTRQQFAKMIMLALGSAVPKATGCEFTDVPSSGSADDPLYPTSYVAACAALGITVGKTANTFDPYGEITRAQLITMVARAENLPDPPASYEPPFPDFSATHFPWARRAAYAGLLDGLVGMGPNYDFSVPATRGEVCLLLAGLGGN